MVARHILGVHPRRAGPSNGASGSGGYLSSVGGASEHRGDVGVWDGGRGHGLNSGGSNFIRLNDIKEEHLDRVGPNASTRGAITVSHAFAWREEVRGSAIEDVEQAPGK